MKNAMKQKKIVGAGLCVALLLLAGCENHKEETDASRNQTGGLEVTATDEVDINKKEVLVAEVGENFDSLNPIKASTQAARTLAVNCFEGLMKLDENGKLVTGQADSYKVSEDGLIYTFTLRDDIHWSDGSDVTAEDFVHAWQQLIVSDNGSKIQMVENAAEIIAGKQQASKLGIKAINEKTVEIVLCYPDPFFLDVCADAACVPIKEDFAADGLDTWSKDVFVCNGPYVIAGLLESGVMLEKNTEYYNENAVTRDKLQLVWNQENVLNDLEKANLFFAESIVEEASETSIWSSQSSIREKLLGIFIDDLNAKGESEAAHTVRNAVGLAVDRVYIAYEMGNDWKDLESFVPEDWLNNTEGLTWNTGDFEKDCDEAETAFYEAGIDPSSIQLYVYEDLENSLITDLIADMWQTELKVTIKKEKEQQDGAIYDGYAFVCERTAESSNRENFVDLRAQDSGFYMPEIKSNDLETINDDLREVSVLIPICYTFDSYGVNNQVENIYSQNGCRYFMYLKVK